MAVARHAQNFPPAVKSKPPASKSSPFGDLTTTRRRVKSLPFFRSLAKKSPLAWIVAAVRCRSCCDAIPNWYSAQCGHPVGGVTEPRGQQRSCAEVTGATLLHPRKTISLLLRRTAKKGATRNK